MDIAGLWTDFTVWVGDGTGLPDTIIHVHAGLAVLLVARLVTGRSLGTLIPLSLVVAAEAGNEILDRVQYGSWRWSDTLGDIANTLFWPVVICIAIRLRPMVARDVAHHTTAPDPLPERAPIVVGQARSF